MPGSCDPFYVGFPGETEEDFQILLDWLLNLIV